MVPRRATAGEADALVRVIDAAYQPYRDKGIALPDVSAGVVEAIAAGEAWVIADQAPLGVMMLRVGAPDAHLMNLAVAPQEQGRGIAGALVRHAVAIGQENGCAGINLATHVQLTKNVLLYEHLGWIETGRDGLRVFMRRCLVPPVGG